MTATPTPSQDRPGGSPAAPLDLAENLSDVELALRPDWSRPPFEPGNELSIKHGAYSTRYVGPVAEQLVAAVLSDVDVGYLQTPAYQPALRAWAAAEARVILLEKWVSAMSIECATESGQGRTSALEQLRRWEATAMTHRARLGLDPLSRARLGRDVAAAQIDIAEILTRLREAGAAAIPQTVASDRNVSGDEVGTDVDH